MLERSSLHRFLLVCAAGLTLGGVNGSAQSSAPAGIAAAPAVSGSELASAIAPACGSFRYAGRIDFSDASAPVLIWQGTTVGVEFSGARIVVCFGKATGQNFFDAVIDGRTRLIAVPEGPGSAFELSIPGAASGRHQLTLFKRSEAAAGCVQFRGVRLESGARAWSPKPPLSRLRMEFVGDSITVGACNEDGPADQWTYRGTHDYGESYAHLIAVACGADERCIAVSGMGVATGWVPMTAGQIWNRIYPDPASRIDDLGAWKPDVLLVNLGENDGSYPAAHGRPFPLKAFEAGYVALVRSIRSSYPRAELVLLRGGMHNGARNPALAAAWGRAVHTLEASDPRISHYVFSHWTETHPRVKDDEALAAEFEGWLRSQPFFERFQ